MKYLFMLLISSNIFAQSLIRKSIIDSVPTTNDTWESQVVPDGKVVRIMTFGAADPAIGDGIDSVILLQWGSSGSFETIRVCAGQTCNFDVNLEFVGDGTKKFRVTRFNNSSTSKNIAFWLEALIKG